MDDLQARLLAELRTWAADNPFADSDEAADAIAEMIERAAADEPTAGDLEERVWLEWRRIEDERSAPYGG